MLKASSDFFFFLRSKTDSITQRWSMNKFGQFVILLKLSRAPSQSTIFHILLLIESNSIQFNGMRNYSPLLRTQINQQYVRICMELNRLYCVPLLFIFLGNGNGHWTTILTNIDEKKFVCLFFLISLAHSRFLFLGKVIDGIGDKFQSDSICMHIKHSNDSHSGHWIRYIRSMHTYLEWMATIAHSYTIWNCTSLASSYTQLMYSVELWNLFIVLYALGKEFETNVCAPLAAKQYALHLYAARVHDVNFH